MEKTNFEKLEVYQKAEQLADLTWQITLNWNRYTRDTVGKQLVRAVDSVPENLAEGSGRGTVKDRKHFVRIARGSMYEAKNWIRRAHKRGLLSKDDIENLKPLVAALPPMLNAYLRSIK